MALRYCTDGLRPAPSIESSNKQARLTTDIQRVTIAGMINTFRHKGLRDLFLEGQTRGVQQSHVRRLRIILQVLHAAVVLSDMDRPGLNLHPLKGDLQGYWAVKVDGNYRVIFRFADGKAWDVDLIDYH